MKDARFTTDPLGSILVGALYGNSSPRYDEPVVRAAAGDGVRLEATFVAGEFDVVCTYVDDVGGDRITKSTERVPILWDNMPVGGRRAWFLCPSCGRRVRELFLVVIAPRARCERCAALKR